MRPTGRYIDRRPLPEYLLRNAQLTLDVSNCGAPREGDRVLASCAVAHFSPIPALTHSDLVMPISYRPSFVRNSFRITLEPSWTATFSTMFTAISAISA